MGACIQIYIVKQKVKVSSSYVPGFILHINQKKNVKKTHGKISKEY